MATEERALRDELNALARKKQQIIANRRANDNKRGNDRVSNTSGNLYSGVTSRGSKTGTSVAPRRGSGGSTGSGDRQSNRSAAQPAGDDRGGGGGRLSKRQLDHQTEPRKVDDQSSDKRQRRLSSDAKEEPRRRSDNVPRENAANPRERRRAVAPEGLARSRRMFGALMGHLGKAKAMIEKDSTLLQKQTSKQLEAEQKEKEQSKALEMKAMRHATIAKLEILISTTEIEMKESLARTKLGHLQQTRKAESQSRVLMTVASPSISYLPKKHTKETEDLLTSFMEAYNEKSVISAREHEAKLREIELEFTAKLDKCKRELDEATRDVGGEDEEMKEAESAVEEKEEETKVDKDDKDAQEDMDDMDKKDEKDKTDAKTDAKDAMDAMDMIDNKDVVKGDKGDSSVEAHEANDGSADEAMGAEHEEEAASPVRPAVVNSAPSGSPVQSSKGSLPVKEQPATLERSSAASRKRAAYEEDTENAVKRTKTDAHAEENAVDAETPSAPVSSSTPEVVEKPTVTSADPPPSTATQSGDCSEVQQEVAFSTPQKQKIQVATLKVTELRQELKKRGLDTKGLKANLIQRLEDALDE